MVLAYTDTDLLWVVVEDWRQQQASGLCCKVYTLWLLCNAQGQLRGEGCSCLVPAHTEAELPARSKNKIII